MFFLYEFFGSKRGRFGQIFSKQQSETIEISTVVSGEGFFLSQNWFSCNIFDQRVCCTTEIFSQPDRTMLGQPSAYLQRVHKLLRNFMRRLKVKFYLKNRHFSSSSSEYSNPSTPQKIHFSWFWLDIS